MTHKEVKEIIANAAEDEEFDTNDLEEMFRALYHRSPDAQDWADGVFSLICAAVEEI